MMRRSGSKDHVGAVPEPMDGRECFPALLRQCVKTCPDTSGRGKVSLKQEAVGRGECSSRDLVGAGNQKLFLALRRAVWVPQVRRSQQLGRWWTVNTAGTLLWDGLLLGCTLLGE